jgi:hypothetical protein
MLPVGSVLHAVALSQIIGETQHTLHPPAYWMSACLFLGILLKYRSFL